MAHSLSLPLFAASSPDPALSADLSFSSPDPPDRPADNERLRDLEGPRDPAGPRDPERLRDLEGPRDPEAARDPEAPRDAERLREPEGDRLRDPDPLCDLDLLRDPDRLRDPDPLRELRLEPELSLPLATRRLFRRCSLPDSSLAIIMKSSIN